MKVFKQILNFYGMMSTTRTFFVISVSLIIGLGVAFNETRAIIIGILLFLPFQGAYWFGAISSKNTNSKDNLSHQRWTFKAIKEKHSQ